ncbi:LysR family transcriptional regulator [Alteromonas sp. ASW11-19]|uniref:LysR family transcriptional regulator n=1 Tax=Alteromonas salexigens TaxID=2982530 RepID=A0ABT2VMN6_9ALTE|nr:LysR family transcriptional regulator [Alteromonas salexigens]MCU7553244.1 LysR family transcriptional regulator [Alteromonas salexigens]
MNTITFRLLEVFQHVVDAGSVTAASNALSLSQPTVSLQLKKLSKIVGMPLLEYVHGKATMTTAGEAVYCCAQEVLSSQRKLNSQVHAIQGLEVGTLKLAVVTSAKYIIPPLLTPYCQAHPNIDIHFTVGNRDRIANRLRHNKDDLYIFSYPPASDELQCLPIAQNRLQVIAPPDYTGPEHCSLAALASCKFLLREAGSGTRRAIEEYCVKHDIELSRTMIVESNEAIRLAVASGLGLAILSEHTLAHGPDEQVKVLNVNDFPLRNQWQAVTVKSRPMSLATRAFLDQLTPGPATITGGMNVQ